MQKAILILTALALAPLLRAAEDLGEMCPGGPGLTRRVEQLDRG